MWARARCMRARIMCIRRIRAALRQRVARLAARQRSRVRRPFSAPTRITPPLPDLSAAVGAGSSIALTTGTVVNVTTLSLTAGDWDVRGIAAFTGTSAQCTSQSGGVNATSATLPGATAGGVVGIATTAVLGNCIYDIAPTRFSLAATTPIYLVANATFTTGAASVYGQISARRVR